MNDICERRQVGSSHCYVYVVVVLYVVYMLFSCYVYVVAMLYVVCCVYVVVV